MVLTVTLLPSFAETRGNHMPDPRRSWRRATRCDDAPLCPCACVAAGVISCETSCCFLLYALPPRMVVVAATPRSLLRFAGLIRQQCRDRPVRQHGGRVLLERMMITARERASVLRGHQQRAHSGQKQMCKRLLRQ